MSWMDSWSRPSKSQATPAPYYLLPGGEDTPYCHSCGRVISSKRSGNASTTKDKDKEVKYCSSRCRSNKPGKMDRDIEGVFVGFLSGTIERASTAAAAGTEAGGDAKAAKPHKAKKAAGAGKKVKGDARVLVSCDEVERHVFPREDDAGSEDGHTDEGSVITDPEPAPLSPVESRGGTQAGMQEMDSSAPGTGTGTLEDPASAQEVDYDRIARLSVRSGTRVRPSQDVSEVNGSVGGEKGRAERVEETEEMLEKRREGLRKVRQREQVRCAARRGVVFGFLVAGGDDKVEGERRKCEAVMLGKVVEPSFAKGDWGVRWRE